MKPVQDPPPAPHLSAFEIANPVAGSAPRGFQSRPSAFRFKTSRLDSTCRPPALQAPRPELQLLLCCARPVQDAATIGRLHELLRRNLDWPYLRRAALRHGMRPLLFQRLNAHCRDAVPPPVLATLRREFEHNAQRNLLLSCELHELLRLFESEGVRCLAYKGPALAVAVYGGLALRQFCDIDILVPPADVPQAKRLLLARRYQPQNRLKGSGQKIFLGSECEEGFTRADGKCDGGYRVELQWAVTSSDFACPLDVASLWRRRVEVSLLGRAVPAPRPEDLLLVLCVHGAKHFWSRLEWVAGVAALTDSTSRARHDEHGAALDWQEVLRAATVSGSRRMLFLGLLLAHDLLQTRLPAFVLEAARADAQAAKLAAQARRRLLRPAHGTEFDSEREQLLFPLRARERLRDKAAYCLRRAVTPSREDWMLLPLPAAPAALYYLLRLLRLPSKGALDAFHALAGGRSG